MMRPDYRLENGKGPSWKSSVLVILPLIFVLTFMSPGNSHAEEHGNADSSSESTPEATPETTIDTRKLELGLGYFYLDVDGGGQKSVPYGLLESHPVVKFDYYLPASWGTLDLYLDYASENYNQFKGDVIFDWGQFQLKSRYFPKNTVHMDLPPLTPPPPGTPIYAPDDENPNDQYQKDIREQTAFFKFKVPKYPAHVKFNARRYTVEGDTQQIFLDENCTSACHNVSQTRPVKTTTDQLGIGIDAHVGWVDLSYNFKNTTFNDGKPDPVYYFGPISSGSPTSSGYAVHNTYPDISSQEHQLNISTNITGRVTGGLGVGVGDRKNEDVDLSEDYQNLMGYLTWKPSSKIALALRGKQLTSQDNAPAAGSQAYQDRVADGLPLEYGSKRTRSTASLSYYPVNGVKFQGEYNYEDIERKDEEAWGLPQDSTTDGWNLLAQVNRWRKLNLKASYGQKNTANPSYDITSTNSSEAVISALWMVRTNLSLIADLKNIDEKNDESGRDSERQFISGGIAYVPVSPLSLGFYYFRFNDDVKQDLSFNGPGLGPITDPDVPYEANSDQYLVQVTWTASKKVELKGEYSYLSSDGSYQVNEPAFQDVGDYSRLEAVQQESSLDLLYSMGKGWDLAARIARLEYDDKISSTGDEQVNKVGAVVSRRW